MKTKTITTACMVALVLSLCGCARALGARAERGVQQLQQRFSAADQNHDGRLSREEARQGMPWVDQNFDAIDTTRSGFVDFAQLQAFARQQARSRRTGGTAGQ